MPSDATSAAPSAPRRRGPHAPSFLRPDRHPPRPALRERRLVLAGIGVLALALVLQILLANRASLAADARWRPVVGGLCSVAGCTLPPWREPDAFTMIERDVRAHPSAAGALRVAATFRNDARWPQPWPTLVLTLSDVDGRAVGARVRTRRRPGRRHGGRHARARAARLGRTRRAGTCAGHRGLHLRVPLKLAPAGRAR